MIDDPHLPLLENSLSGKTSALEELIQIFQPKVFSLALKFLWNPEDAEDATQEILVKVITNLGGFRRESKLSTWIYRIASNHLINVQKSKIERRKVHLRVIREELHRTQVPYNQNSQIPIHLQENESEPKISELVLHVQVACTYAMLQGLTRPYRMAYILGEVFQTSSEEGASVMGVRSETFRQRLSRSRKQMETFLGKECSLTNVNNSCQCSNRITYAMKAGRIKSYLKLSEQMKQDGRWKEIKPMMSDTSKIRKAAEVFRNQPEFLPKKNQLENIRTLLDNSFPLATR
ncbi:RNA polymerase sigma factor [Leptospira sp. 2 VSF19]|uniref:RNA polymerase sigma factor n=1 Tax=Leptospira soteropolitanensis TaxID=2950025 RepID=A0AAW5VEP6_9LEPT|nr:RNA polymerase sigma factor [Leptospira soteropolitanensis]MCW7491105.1 RNA polymerase sigma factor [Leptospira soteropolitanensis]MCW7498689.1 RNA polymerase sigma factor [Leptospira soteropolitanensis]MCW7521718.1 RNA polymerase sigma factor [Leptospira soteropolitanensis]MCW7524793.1 RNA polymerase sigma factor [Leptospira soteropolitanensis]MCW7528660.1 RNA polymerase sigma factor [Leptospira soteropolitanensis]